ncbi:BON domain-containing protein [Trinickia dinghuensis]|uniref:BON domain-containing protein n=1 Tax=Trinickia dinghuensis TaxID=2291023 RepID=A0A3D8JTX1_9BURK|nr:BON domain-containing protein [Trinickia dinghuensis]RDU96543.1 BON domain-containing protein [Trinickia dinghuensis]
MKALPLLKIAAVVASLTLAAGVSAQTAASDTSTTGAAAPSSSSESIGQHIDDGTVTTKVKAALVTAKDVKSTHIHVKTRRGTVWLTGTVPSSDEKTRAAQVAEGVTGVHAVRNRLKISSAE